MGDRRLATVIAVALAEPRKIYNGGVPSGLVKRIHWKTWGSATSLGKGRGYQYKPEGGYYRRTGEP
jgi:hypothetical protein